MKSLDLVSLEKAFSDLKAGTDVDMAVKSIRRIMKRNFDVEYDINLVENRTGKFFGMSIYPESNQMDVMIDAMLGQRNHTDAVVELWNKNKVWTLEIDSMLLEDHNLNASPAEMVAVLLHEQGHVVYSNTVPQRIAKIVRFEVAKANFTLKKLLQWKKSHKLFKLVFVEAIGSKSFQYINLNNERIADKFVVKMGYGEHLNDFIDKLIRSHGNQMVNRPEQELDQDTKLATRWVLSEVAQLEFRMTMVRRLLQTEMLKNPSLFVRDVVNEIKQTFFGSQDSKDGEYKDVTESAVLNEAVVEHYLMREYKSVVMEASRHLFDKNGKLKKVTQLDLDILSVEAGRIENEDDKIYVLDLIYDKMTFVDAGLDFINSNEKDKVQVSKETLLSYQKQLHTIRQTVLDMHIQPKQYGVRINYPKGYEG